MNEDQNAELLAQNDVLVWYFCAENKHVSRDNWWLHSAAVRLRRRCRSDVKFQIPLLNPSRLQT